MASCRCCSSYTIPAYIWAVLSILAAIACPFGLYFSNWLERETPSGKFHSVSSFRICLNETNRFSASCDSYLTFGEAYSTVWKAVTLIMGGGACFLILVALTAIFGFFVRKLFNKAVVALTMMFQALGVLLFIVGILMFPAGMDAEEVRNVELCGSSADRYKLGECSVGWAFILIIVGTIIGLVATAMAWTPLRWRDKETEASYSI